MGFFVFLGGGDTKLLLFAMKRHLVGGISSVLDREEVKQKVRKKRREGKEVVLVRKMRAKAEERCVQKTD